MVGTAHFSEQSADDVRRVVEVLPTSVLVVSATPLSM